MNKQQSLQNAAARKNTVRALGIGLVMIFIAASDASAAEIYLKNRFVCQGPKIFLGDIADIYHVDAEEAAAWAKLELFPAPPPATERTLDLRDLQNALRQAGVDLTVCRFAGASEIQVSRPAPPPAAQPARTIPFPTIRETTPPERKPQPTSPLTLVAVRPIQRGDRVQPGDVELQPVAPRSAVSDLVYRVEDAVGLEATRDFAPGKPISSRGLQSPQLVRRGEPVAIYARAAGVVVRTKGIVQDDGAKGDLVPVLLPDRRQTLLGRVVDYQSVEIWASGSRVSDGRGEQTASASPTVR